MDMAAAACAAPAWAHPYAVAVESALLAPKAEVSLYTWIEPRERIALGGTPHTHLPAGASTVTAVG